MSLKELFSVEEQAQLNLDITEQQKQDLKELKNQIRNIDKKDKSIEKKEEFIRVSEIEVLISKFKKYSFAAILLIIMSGSIIAEKLFDEQILFLLLTKFIYGFSIGLIIMFVVIIIDYRKEQNNLLFSYLQRKNLANIKPVVMVVNLDNGTKLYYNNFIKRLKNKEYEDTNFSMDTKNKLASILRRVTI